MEVFQQFEPMKHLFLAILLSIGMFNLGAQEYRLPLDLEPVLAGNYGELRPNHFHAGLDFKTQQTTGHAVHAVADGYVERVGINAYGYGLVLYVTHPDIERMTVYGHLETFNDEIWKKVRERQVKEELNNADLTFGPEELPVKKGDIIALSGNTGSSGGPHVHFEIRGLMSAPGADDEYWYDPMPYFANKIKDTTPPKVSNLYIYSNPNTAFTKHNQILNRTANAWGKVGFGIKAYDYMDGTSNKYGIKKVNLFCDNELIYKWNQEQFQYHEQRYTNSIIDYAEYTTMKSVVMKTFVETNNKLCMIDHTIGNGIVDINEERAYHFRYELEDAHGNKSELNFTVNGVKRDEPEQKIAGRLAEADKVFMIDSLGVNFRCPAGNLYTDADITFSSYVSKSVQNLSPVFTIGSATIPLHSYCDLQIDLPDTITSGNQLYIANLSGGSYKCEYTPAQDIPFSSRVLPPTLKTKVRDFGSYVIRHDTDLPRISFVGNPTSNSVMLSITDASSGLERWKVYIDGKFVPSDMNNRGKIVATPAKYGIRQGIEHTIEVHAFDLVGNEGILIEKRRF